MRINEHEFMEYNASVVRFSPASMEFEQNLMLGENSYYPIMGGKTMKPQTRELVIDFVSEEDISNFSAEVQQETILDLDDGYLYRCFPLGFGKISEEAYGAYTGVYSFMVLKQKPLVSELLSTTLNNQGNIETNVIFEITSETALAEFTLGDIKIHDLSANRTMVIDGIHKLIFYQDEPQLSAFHAVELYRFPSIDTGVNEILKSNESVQVVVKYYPTFM